MYLTYNDLAKLFPKTKGIKDNFEFHTVTTNATIIQPKGLFIPVNEQSGELKQAIQNGAIGSLWLEHKELPSYLPNHFPIFFYSHLQEAVDLIINNYTDHLFGEKNNLMNMTKFLFIDKTILNEDEVSYDIPVLMTDTIKEGRE